MITFKKLRITNFLSWEGEHVFDLENSGLVYITGSNGAGKSNIFDSLVWCLFGVTSKPVSIQDLANRTSPKDCSVKVSFKLNNKIYVIARYRNHRLAKNNVIIFVNKKKINIATNQEANDYIKKLLGMDYRKFIQTVFFSQSDRRYFTYLGETEKRAVLSTIYSFDIFKKAQEAAKVQMQAAMADLDSVEFTYKNQRSTIKDLDIRIESLVEQLKDTSGESVDLASVKKDLRETEDSLESNLCKLNDAYAILGVANKYRLQKDWAKKLVATITASIKEIRVQKRCPTCNQVLNKEANKEALAKFNIQLDEADEEVKRLNGLIKELNLTQVQEQVDTLENTLKVLRKKKTDLHALYVKATTSKSLLQEQLLKERDSRKKAFVKYKKAKKDYVKHRTEVEYLDFWVYGFGNSGLEIYALTRVLPHFNKEINKYLRFLPTSKGYIKVNYEMDSNHLVSNILYYFSGKKDPVLMSFDSLSGGEKRRVEICTALALGSLSGFNSNILLLDEIFDGIEASLYPDVVKLLHSLGTKSVFVTSHNSELRTHFPNTWFIQLDSLGNSQIQQLNKIGLELL